VTVSRGREVSSADAIDISQSEFRAFVEFGITCLKRVVPCLVAIGGVSGAGKSTLGYNLAPQLAPQPGAIMLRSDIIRKNMMHVSETEPLPASAYTDEMHERVYSMLGDEAAVILSAGYSVIADAVFGDPVQRDNIAQSARKAGAPFKGLWLKAAPVLLERRIAARRGDASDATIAILHRQLAHVTSPADWQQINAAGSAEETLSRVCAALKIASRASHGIKLFSAG
jgi:predicted kinase